MYSWSFPGRPRYTAPDFGALTLAAAARAMAPVAWRRVSVRVPLQEPPVVQRSKDGSLTAQRLGGGRAGGGGWRGRGGGRRACGGGAGGAGPGAAGGGPGTAGARAAGGRAGGGMSAGAGPGGGGGRGGGRGDGHGGRRGAVGFPHF